MTTRLALRSTRNVNYTRFDSLADAPEARFLYTGVANVVHLANDGASDSDVIADTARLIIQICGSLCRH